MPTEAQREAARRRIREDTPFWAERFAKVIDKKRKLVPLVANAGQLELDRLLEEQRVAGKPMRALALKARQVGISTWSQAKLVQRSTQFENYNTITVANDRKTGPKLYRMAELMYENLPADKELGIKPPIGHFARGQTLHFGDQDRGTWESGSAFPNSTYEVDTANDGNAGRGSTPQGVHLSELAFWNQMSVKLTALLNGVPDEPETIVIGESTANGENEFFDLWDDAEKGVSGFIPFFWPWYSQLEYTMPFANEAEKEAFAGEVGSGPFGEEEPDLIRDYGITLEQLHWRRWIIANKSGGDLRMFHQEYPTTAEQAFLSTGKKVFDSFRLNGLRRHVEHHDPRVVSPDNPGPAIGEFIITTSRTEEGRTGPVTIPNGTLWIPWESGPKRQPWKLWVPPEQIENNRESTYIMAVDPSGGEVNESDKPDFHSIQVIDHKTREQVAEFANRQMDPDLVAVQALLAALFFNNAWIAVERNGGFGLPIIRKLFLDFHYPFLYRSKRFGSSTEKAEHKYGWHTSVATKPMIVSGMQARLREEDFGGVKSRELAGEFSSYTRDDRGRTTAAPKAFDDRLMAYMIAQQVASETPLMDDDAGGHTSQPAPARSGLGSYDSRFS